MQAFPALFRKAVLQRSVALVPLLTVICRDDTSSNPVRGYMSDRTIQVPAGGQLYQRRLISWNGIKFSISNEQPSGGTSTQTATFTLSNIDRVLEMASRLHPFYRAQVIFQIYCPAVIATYGGTVTDAVVPYWQGFVASFKLTEETMELSCKDGYFGLTRPSPRRRVTRDCDIKFDDGCFCPYSGYENTGGGTGVPSHIADMQGVIFNECGVDGVASSIPTQNNEFGQNLMANEGWSSLGGYTTCPKDVQSCANRGMLRWFGGTRYVSSWAGVSAQGQGYASYSSPNDSIFNNAMPRLYGGGGFVLQPSICNYRVDRQYLEGEAFLGQGPMGNNASGVVTSSGQAQTVSAIYSNGQLPIYQHGDPNQGYGQYSGSGKIGDTTHWDVIGGSLFNSFLDYTPPPGKPHVPIYFSGTAGVYCNVADNNAGIQNPQVTNGQYQPEGAPTIMVLLHSGGLRTWVYDSATTRHRDATDSAAWMVLDLFLDALDLVYTNLATHQTVADLQSFVDHAAYCSSPTTSLVDGSQVPRYASRGTFNQTRPALDNLDAGLKDCWSYRIWRGGRIAVAPFCGGQLDTMVRPGFEEFVNILDKSLNVTTAEPTANEYQMNFSDRDYDYQKNTATVYSESFQVFSGVEGHRDILSQSLNLTTTFTTDQATRIGALQLRFDIGGNSQDDWQQKRDIEWDATFAMGELECGDITYVAHTLLPGGGQWVRIGAIELSKEWKLHFKARTFRVTDYDDTAIGATTADPPVYVWSPLIPGSLGKAYQPLPALAWRDTCSPAVDTPGTGVLLQWNPYASDNDNLLKSVQIYRTADPVLSAGGYLLVTQTAASTHWQVDPADFDFAVGDTYQIDLEQVKVTTIDATNGFIDVARAQNNTLAAGHYHFAQIYSVAYLDRVPQPAVAQANLPDLESYIDPWVGLS
jgi:hypothetical protein